MLYASLLTVVPLTAQSQFVWKTPDFDGMRKFLVEEKQFNADRIENVIKRLQKTQVRETGSQLSAARKHLSSIAQQAPSRFKSCTARGVAPCIAGTRAPCAHACGSDVDVAFLLPVFLVFLYRTHERACAHIRAQDM